MLQSKKTDINPINIPESKDRHYSSKYSIKKKIHVNRVNIPMQKQDLNPVNISIKKERKQSKKTDINPIMIEK